MNYTILKVINGVSLVEHPVYGDEAPVQMLVEGGLIETPFWDTDDPEEIRLWIQEEAQ